MLSKTILYLKYLAYLNREVTITNNAEVKYSEPIYFGRNITTEFTISPECFNPPHSVPDPLLFPPKYCQIIPPSVISTGKPTQSMYLILFDYETPMRTVIERHRHIIFDPSVLTIVMEKSLLQIMLADVTLVNPSRALAFVVKDYVSLTNVILNIVLVAGLILACNLVCRRIIDKMSEKDPVYSDFVISDAQLKRFKEVEIRTESNCTICFEDLKDEDEVRVLSCGHFYHPDCIDRWLIGHSKHCPYCRSNIEIAEKI